MGEKQCPTVSVLVPVRNEEAHIELCLASIFAQDYPQERMELLFIDGMSTDQTVAILKAWQQQAPNLHILENPQRTVPFAMNAGIRHSTGEYIVRLDAHSSYPPTYISGCLRALRDHGADNAGGLSLTRGRSYVGRAIAGALSSVFGVGNSQFRIGGKSGFVDTVPFGAFHRSLFDRIGLYDTRLTRNQDNELNYRIRKNGGKIYLDAGIHSEYYCRDSLPQLGRMAFWNGAWNVITMALCPGSMGLRHFIPLLFVLFLIGAPLLAWLTGWGFFVVLLGIVGGAYLMLDGFYAYQVATQIGLRYLPVLPLIYPLFHIAYGLGSLCGLWMLPRVRRRPPGTGMGAKP